MQGSTACSLPIAANAFLIHGTPLGSVAALLLPCPCMAMIPRSAQPTLSPSQHFSVKSVTERRCKEGGAGAGPRICRVPRWKAPAGHSRSHPLGRHFAASTPISLFFKFSQCGALQELLSASSPAVLQMEEDQAPGEGVVKREAGEQRVQGGRGAGEVFLQPLPPPLSAAFASTARHSSL